jgi:undecaprenyl-diphosphatase
MEYLRLIFLGLVQGITEFLPISSDGHLNVAERLFGQFAATPDGPADLMTTVILHLGTLGSILVVFGRRLWHAVARDRRVLGLLFVGTLPAAVVGLSIERYFESALKDALLTGCMLPLNGAMLLWISRRPPATGEYAQLGYRQALAVGVLQALAILPGISRSGTTIAAGVGVGLKRTDAATFSFLLAMPVIGGAVLLKFYKLASGTAVVTDVGPLVVGTIVSFAAGLAALKLLIRLLERGGLAPLAWWCIALGFIVLGWQLAQS